MPVEPRIRESKICTSSPAIFDFRTENSDTAYIEPLLHKTKHQGDTEVPAINQYDTNMKARSFLTILFALLALAWYDINSFTPSSIDRAILDARVTMNAADHKRAALWPTQALYTLPDQAVSLFASRPCVAASYAIRVRKHDQLWLAEVHRVQAELYLERLEVLRGIVPRMIVARAEVWAWVRWFWFTTAVSARAADLLGGSFTDDSRLLGRLC